MCQASSKDRLRGQENAPASVMTAAQTQKNKAASWFSTRLTVCRERLRGVGWIWLVFAVGFLADLLSTGWMFSCYGSEVELHPVIRLVGDYSGPWTTAMLGKAGQLLGLAVLIPILDVKLLRATVLIAGILYFLASLFNVWQTLL